MHGMAKFFFASAFGLGLLAATPALPAGGEDIDRSGAPVSTLDLTFELYAGGIPLGEVAMNARLQGGEYKAISTLETLGVVSTFWQSKVETAANGTLSGGTMHPSLYDSFSQYRRAGRRQVTLASGLDGTKTVISDPPYPETRYPVPVDEQRNSLDPLSGMMFLIAGSSANKGQPCKAVAPIFDGRRRYDVGIDFVRRIDIRMSSGLYEGPGMMCRIHYNQVAGYQQTLVEQGKRLPPIYAWVAPVRSTSDPGRQYMLPLRIWAETEYGIVVALATVAKLDGAPLGRH